MQTRQKDAHSSGPLKFAFDSNFVMVYPTGGTPAENAASYARANYDAGYQLGREHQWSLVDEAAGCGAYEEDQSLRDRPTCPVSDALQSRSETEPHDR